MRSRAAALAVCAFIAGTTAAMAAPTPPNIVCIIADDMGFGDLGCYNPQRKIPTPHKDIVASLSTLLERYQKDGHRVPFIAWWPGKIPAGTLSHQLLGSVDLMATIAALVGRELNDAERRDSINMLPVLTGNPEQPLRTELVLCPNKTSHMSLRKGMWMYIPARSDGGFTGSKPDDHAWGAAAVTTLVNTPNSDIVAGKIKPDAQPAQLYDLEADVNQTTNLYSRYPEVVSEMQTVLDSFQVPTPPAPENNPKRKKP